MNETQNRPNDLKQEGGFLHGRLKGAAEFIGSGVLFLAAGIAGLAAFSETLLSFDDATMHPLDKDI